MRSLWGYMEAVTYSFAYASQQQSSQIGFEISNRDRAVIEERDYDSATNECLPKGRRYPLAIRWETASRLFLAASGAQPPSPWTSAVTEHFRVLSRARNKLTHPSLYDDLLVIPPFESFRQVAIWFLSESSQHIWSCARAAGLSTPTPSPLLSVPPLDVATPNPADIFNKAFYELVFSDPSVAIKYIGMFSKEIDGELGRALHQGRSAYRPDQTSLEVGRAVRRFVRSVTVSAEATLGLTSFFLRAVRRSSAKVSVPQPAKGESVPKRLIRTLAAFSHAFGAGQEPERGGGWYALCATFELRDRLTHPKNALDVNLNLEHLEAPMDAVRWLLGPANVATSLDLDKIADCVGRHGRRTTTRSTQDQAR